MVVAVLCGCGSSRGPAPVLLPRQTAPILMGAWVPAANAEGQMASFEALDRTLGCTLSIDPHYRGWDRIRLFEERTDVEAGRIPMISWSAVGSTTASAIAGGTEDRVIRAAAVGVRSLVKPVFIRFGFEMDQRPGAPGSHNIGPPDEFKAAWRRIVGIFRAEHATNAQFVWSATALGFASGSAQKFYPGSSYVQWVAADGYNRYPSTSWQEFDDIFTPFYTWAVATHKPLMVSESGSTSDPGDPRRLRDWLVSAERWVVSHTRIRAWVYNDALSPTGFDFRLRSPAGIHTLRAMSGFLGRHTPGCGGGGD
jgi:hypothetical protein